MPSENLRSLVGTSTTKVGTFLFEFATPGIGQILKAVGADFAVLDMEHTGFGFETVRQVDYIAYRNTLENYDPTVWGLYKPEWTQFRAQ